MEYPNEVRPRPIGLLVTLCVVLFVAAPAVMAQAESSRVYLPLVRTFPRGQLVEIAQIGGALNAAALDGEVIYFGQGPRVVALDVSEPERPRKLGHSGLLPGVVSDMVRVGAYLLANLEGRWLVSLDVSSPGSPRLLRVLPLAEAGGGSANARARIQLRQQRAYLTLAQGLQIVDIADPARPRLVGERIEHFWGPVSSGMMRATPAGLAIQGRTAVAGWHTGFDFPAELVVYDIADPSRMVPLAHRVLPEARIHSMALAQDRLLVVDDHAVDVFDFRDPAMPKLSSSLRHPEFGLSSDLPEESQLLIPRFSARAAAWADRTAWLSGDGGLYAVDLANRKRPRLIHHEPSIRAGKLLLEDSRLLTLPQPARLSQLGLVDVSDRRRPRLLLRHQTIGRADRVWLVGRRAVVSEELLDSDAGFRYRAEMAHILDLESSVEPRAIGRIDGRPSVDPRGAGRSQTVMAVAPAHLWTWARSVADGAQQAVPWSLADPAMPLPGRAIDLPEPMLSSQGVAWQGETLYLPGQSRAPSVWRIGPEGGVLRMPLEPEFRRDTGRLHLVVVDTWLYARSREALWAVELDHPSGWRARRPVGILADTFGLFVADRQSLYLLRSLRSSTLQIWDRMPPGAPSLLDHIALPDIPRHMIVDAAAEGQRLYVLTRSGISVLGRAGPRQLERIDELPVAARDLDVEDGLVAVAAGDAGLRLYAWR